MDISHGYVAQRVVFTEADPQPRWFPTFDLQDVGICAEVHVQSHRAREDQRQ